jgi:hypothetical protein
MKARIEHTLVPPIAPEAPLVLLVATAGVAAVASPCTVRVDSATTTRDTKRVENIVKSSSFATAE